MPFLPFVLLSLPGPKIVEHHAWMDSTWTLLSLCPAWLCYLAFLSFLVPPILQRSAAGAAWFATLLVAFWLLGLVLPTGWLLIVSGLWWASLTFRKSSRLNDKTPEVRALVRRAAGGALFVVALAVAAGFPRYENVGPGPANTCRSNLKNVSTALEMYQTDFEGGYPPTLSKLTPNYLKTLPACPTQGGSTSPYAVELMESGFRVICRSPRHHEQKEWKIEPFVVGDGAVTQRTISP